MWVDTTTPPDGRDAEIKKACEKVLIIDFQQLASNFAEYNDQTKAAMFQWPINCQDVDCPPSNMNVSQVLNFTQ